MTAPPAGTAPGAAPGAPVLARATAVPAAPLRDQFGRSIEYLRISVTDRCNFRCVYCMPAAGLPWLPRPDILTYEEIAALVGELAPLGLRRLRLTGGEPTIRRDLPALVRLLRAVLGIEDIALSTNGVRLPALAGALRDAGLDRVNMSVDSLRPSRIAAIARRDLGFDPLVAARAATAAGLDPLKLNVVVIRGVNDDEIGELARLTREQPWHVRFIELMPVGELAESLGDEFGGPPPHTTGPTGVVDPLARVVPSEEVLARAADALGGLVRVAAGGGGGPGGAPRGNGPAEYYRGAGAAGTVGVITPMTHTYCASCNRVRLTADGRLRTCLYGDHEVDLRTPLRAGAPLAPHLLAALAAKPREHALLERRTGGLRALSQVGG